MTEQLILEPGDIFCTRGENLLSTGIRFCTRSKGEPRTRVNHAGIVVGSGTIMTAPVVEALITVQEHTLFSQYGPPNNDQVVIYRPIGLYPVERQRMADKARSYVGSSTAGQAGHAFLELVLRWCLSFPTAQSLRPLTMHLVVEEAAEVAYLDFGVPKGSTQPDDIDDWCRTLPRKWQCIFPLQKLE